MPSLHPWVLWCRPRDRPLVFAHRGGAGLRPENTLAAFDHASALGADGVELDLRLARNGEVVVLHDPTLARTTNETDPVAARSADELATVDAGYWFAPEQGFPYRGRRYGIPRLREVLRRYPEMAFILELKGDDDEIAREVVRDVRLAGALDRVCVGAYSMRMLAVARAAEAGVCTSACGNEIRLALYRSWIRWPIGRQRYLAFQVPERAQGHRIVSRQFIAAAHRASKLVQVWTVNHESDMRRLIALGVDGLITDRPDLGLAVARARSTRDAPMPGNRLPATARETPDAAAQGAGEAATRRR
jgi:glycerophosphoryl diester phosphodiesterase